MKKINIPRLELKILNVLWGKNQAQSVQEIIDSWIDNEIPGYTTVLKKLQIMEKKCLVSHKRYGKAYRYYALVTNQEVRRSKVRDMLEQLFLGDKVKMIHAFLDLEGLSPEEIDELKRMIREKEENFESGE